jgi:hypothetical protein
VAVQNFLYALIQSVHNLGAATVVGAAAAAIWLVRGEVAAQRRLAMLLAFAWAIQAMSGALFGITTYVYDKQMPDIHGVAVDALMVKVVCAITGFVLAVFIAKWQSGWLPARRTLSWYASLGLGITALSSAAFLRWFS